MTLYKGKVIGRRQLGRLQTLRRRLVNNWCLKRSRLIYAVASRLLSGEVRINIVMRCREENTTDWGHAWVTRNGRPLMEYEGRMFKKPMTKISDTGKYIYWIFN
ncbi:MAG: hypothetical protein IJ155_01120 [Prevotella sp.]|nr:hypothetical protein [Prevotella sp.]MBQ9202823.1 hypothetical protein [Prevotella sp.]